MKDYLKSGLLFAFFAGITTNLIFGFFWKPEWRQALSPDFVYHMIAAAVGFPIGIWLEVRRRRKK